MARYFPNLLRVKHGSATSRHQNQKPSQIGERVFDLERSRFLTTLVILSLFIFRVLYSDDRATKTTIVSAIQK